MNSSFRLFRTTRFSGGAQIRDLDGTENVKNQSLDLYSTKLTKITDLISSAAVLKTFSFPIVYVPQTTNSFGYRSRYLKDQSNQILVQLRHLYIFIGLFFMLAVYL